MIPSWALAIDRFLSPPADGLSLITLSQPQGGERAKAQEGINSKDQRRDQ